jgi:hypothetical protein
MDGGAPLDFGELDEYRVDFTRWPRSFRRGTPWRVLATRLKPIGPNIVFDDDAPLRDARERRAFAACNHVVERSGRDGDLPCSGRNGLIVGSHCLRSVQVVGCTD